MKNLNQMAEKRSIEAEYLNLIDAVVSAASCLVYADFKDGRKRLEQAVDRLDLFKKDHNLE